MNATSFLGSSARENELLQALSKGLGPKMQKSASVEGAEPKTVLSSVMETLVKCADSLDDVGHPAAQKVDEVLTFIANDLLTAPEAAKE